MLFLIFAIIIGIGITLFAFQNITDVTLRLAGYSLPGTPLYAVVIGSILVGLIIGFIYSLIDTIGKHATLFSKDRSISNANATIQSLKHRITDLETENTRLRGNTDESTEQEKEAVQRDDDEERAREHRFHVPFFTRLRESFR